LDLKSHERYPKHPETNSEFAPENGWLEYETNFLLGNLKFSGAFAVRFRKDRFGHPNSKARFSLSLIIVVVPPWFMCSNGEDDY